MPNRLTYKNLFTLVKEEIEKRQKYPYVSDYDKQLSRDKPLFISTEASSGRVDIDIADVITAVHNLLRETLQPTIISGLTVSATSPISSKVIVSSGKGSVGGEVYELASDITLAIPFNSYNHVFYINLYKDTIEVETNQHPSKLTVAKIIVPKPGTTSLVQDTKDDSWNAYIVNFREVHFYQDSTGKLEEDSIEVLRDSIGKVLADNLIGNIRLSENLKIINTAGTLELNSDSLKLYDENDNLLAKFNEKGVYFYNTDGVELARFTNIDARIGNILITENTIQSENFVSGTLGSGFRIRDNGNAEFNNVLVRGKITSVVFEYNKLSAMGGNFLVSRSAGKLNQDMTETSTTLITDGDVQFNVGDILWLKEGNNEEYMTVEAVVSTTTYTVTRASGGSAVAWKKGTAIVNLGQSGDGGLFLTASETNAPYLSVFTHDGNPWNGLNTKLRIGNLNGFLGYTTDKYGIAIGDTEAYLKYDPIDGLRIKGNITITGGNASVTFYQATEPGSSGDPNNPKDGDFWIDTDDNNKTYVYSDGSWVEVASSGITDSNGMIDTPATPSGAGLYLGSSYLGYYSGSEWQSYIQNNGNFQFKGNSSNYIQWDGSTLTVRGLLNADDITTGILSGIVIRGNTIETASSGSRVVMDTNSLIAYDDASAEIFKIQLTGTDVGDIVIGDYANSKGIKWDKSASTFNIKGIITATSGDFIGTVNVGSAGRVYIDGANEVIKVYDESNNLRVELGKLS